MTTQGTAARPATRPQDEQDAQDAPEDAAPAARVPRLSLTPEVWIAAATDVLELEGIDAVRVDVLARHLKVTRGSFYWHFRDREDLLRGVLLRWRQAATEELTLRLGQARSDAREQLRDVLTLPFRGRSAGRAARIELAIRAWARRDEMARQAVDEADAARIGYIAEVFAALGFAAEEARRRALMVYSIDVGSSIVAPLGEMARQGEWIDFVERLMTA